MYQVLKEFLYTSNDHILRWHSKICSIFEQNESLGFPKFKGFFVHFGVDFRLISPGHEVVFDPHLVGDISGVPFPQFLLKYLVVG
jgi:hypothetical protein